MIGRDDPEIKRVWEPVSSIMEADSSGLDLLRDESGDFLSQITAPDNGMAISEAVEVLDALNARLNGE